jgi:Uma2 family endonuclease
MTSPLSPAVTPGSQGNGILAPALTPEQASSLDHLITQDDTPVDSMFAEKEQRLLTEALYSSWTPPGGAPFLALANVGLFPVPKNPALVPDAMLSIGVKPAGDLHTKAGHSYYVWLLGKPPDVVIEIISDRRGGEDSTKMRAYAEMGVPYYVILDPDNELGGGTFRTFRLENGQYNSCDVSWMPEVGLGLRLWEGSYEGQQATWLRWCEQDGRFIPTGAEQRCRADEAQEEARRLADKLRALGVDPEA